MPYERLPPDCERRLDFGALIETLRLLEGETVVAAISMGRMEPSPLLVEGPLSYSGTEDDERTEGFHVGDADLTLHPWTTIDANLHVHDGNDFFNIVIELSHGVQMVIGDPETT